MKLARSISRGPLQGLRLLAAVLAVAGQFGISGASLTLARDESSVISHTERSGIDLHRGHNEATCATCALLAFHASVNAAGSPITGDAVSLLVAARRSVDFVAGPQLLPNSCRAPPRES
jgi:hypothetical protein